MHVSCMCVCLSVYRIGGKSCLQKTGNQCHRGDRRLISPQYSYQEVACHIHSHGHNMQQCRGHWRHGQPTFRPAAIPKPAAHSPPPEAPAELDKHNLNRRPQRQIQTSLSCHNWPLEQLRLYILLTVSIPLHKRIPALRVNCWFTTSRGIKLLASPSIPLLLNMNVVQVKEINYLNCKIA